MQRSSKTRSAKKRVKVRNLPAANKKLTAKNMKKIKGALSGQNTYTGETTMKNILAGSTYGSGS